MYIERSQWWSFIVKLLIFLIYYSNPIICETGGCREQEFRDRDGNCMLCEQCGPGMELSKECGFGYGEDAQCMTCRPNRFKEDWGFQKCKPCLDCAIVNRFQKANCSATSNAVCGDCLPGFYRKTKLGGFQDMECVPCGDPPPPHEPHCTAKVNLVKIPSTASSPRDTALAAVICSALATVLLALLILCVIYCKRQFMEKKPTWSMRSQDVHYEGSELSCFDRPQLNMYAHRTCCQCQRDPSQMCGAVHLIPSLCCDETCSLEHSCHNCTFHSRATLHERGSSSVGEMIPAFLGSLSHSACGDLSDAWPLIQKPTCCDSISSCESYPELIGEDENSFSQETEKTAIVDSDAEQDLTILTTSKSPFGSLTEANELPKKTYCITTSLSHFMAAEPLSTREHDRIVSNSTN
ncbi:tumor necrosis factor receptor superfamily member 19 [Anolis carolinensis]|uniref:tumor necrosis factor receptor superfamily member 19 n=1 Tax=Anolis carolinensis TaxID=28377 RepID=UPI0007DB6B7A|nr:PREDICTED: tumor necrosis factor receptor superfamily member 19 [Anolis carolinensis]|eukprot:XP_008106214.2 PREDICTED: tumor necrosis factor receptor superfamily member 19 [Anolis carolinensis]